MHMAEIGVPMEPPKKGFMEGMRRAFTMKGAKEQWYQDHAELVKKYADVNNGLSEEQRAQVMQKIDDDATKSARLNVVGKWGALAVTGVTLGAGGALIGSEKARRLAFDKLGKPGKFLAVKGAEVQRSGKKMLREGKHLLKTAAEKAQFWKKKAATPATPAPPTT